MGGGRSTEAKCQKTEERAQGTFLDISLPRTVGSWSCLGVSVAHTGSKACRA